MTNNTFNLAHGAKILFIQFNRKNADARAREFAGVYNGTRVDSVTFHQLYLGFFKDIEKIRTVTIKGNDEAKKLIHDNLHTLTNPWTELVDTPAPALRHYLDSLPTDAARLKVKQAFLDACLDALQLFCNSTDNAVSPMHVRHAFKNFVATHPLSPDDLGADKVVDRMFKDSVHSMRGRVHTIPLLFDVIVKHVAMYMQRNMDYAPCRIKLFPYSAVIIDEAQDVSHVQAYIIKELHRRYGTESFAVVTAYDRLQA